MVRMEQPVGHCLSRRRFLSELGGAAGIPLFSCAPANAVVPAAVRGPFKLSVITDEISQDLGHALEVASKEFGLGYVELRSLWDKNIINLDEKEIRETRRLVEKFSLQVTDIASPLFKTDFPAAPKSKYSPTKPQ